MKISLMVATALILTGCKQNPKAPDREMLKKEIIQTEVAFSKMAADSGITRAFLAYAAPDVVIRRGSELIPGYDSVASYLKKSFNKGDSLSWIPDYADVAASGDLAYTYGKYVFSYADSSGVRHNEQGYFHTVWKRQPNGKWKFVWD